MPRSSIELFVDITEFNQLCERIGLLRYGPQSGVHIMPQKILDHMVADGDDGIVMTVLREELDRLTTDNPRAQAFLMRRYGELIPRKPIGR